MGVHGGAWGTIVNNFDYEPHLQSLHRLLLTLRCAKVKINVHLEQGYQERVQCKEPTMDILDRLISISAYGRILVSMSIEGLFTTNICTLTLTLYCHEQLLPNGHGFHAQLLQLIHGKREEYLYVHRMVDFMQNES